jgi:hypothetical protein
MPECVDCSSFWTGDVATPAKPGARGKLYFDQILVDKSDRFEIKIKAWMFNLYLL